MLPSFQLEKFQSSIDFPDRLTENLELCQLAFTLHALPIKMETSELIRRLNWTLKSQLARKN